MSDVLISAIIGGIGVIIGGAIASIIPVMTLIYEHKKWKKEKRIENLRIKKDKLEKLYAETHGRLNDGIIKNSYSSDMISNFECIFPENVFQCFNSMMNEKNKTTKNMRHHFFTIMRSMKKSLVEIDKEIEEELK